MTSLRETLIAFITALTGLPVAANDKPHTDTDPRGQYISPQKAADIAVNSVGGGRAIDAHSGKVLSRTRGV